MSANDNRIETVLSALRDAAPSDNLQQRMNAALRQAAQEKPTFRLWSWLPASRTVAVAMTVAGAFAVTAAFIQHERSHRISAANHVEHVQETRHVAVLATHVADSVPAAQRRHSPVVPVRAVSPDAQPPAPEESSFPAPPMPLTEQERLLLRLAHAHDPVQLAQLVPDAREAAFQHGKEQVREFFKPPPLPVADLPDSNANITGGTK